jgi:purine-cytosine permease-like protein
VVALLGSFAQGGLALYGTGLDTSSIIPRLSRVPATLVISAVSLLFVFLGTFVWDAIDTVSAFLLLLLVLVVPWMMVTLIGYHYAGGRYWAADLQIFNAGGRGGAYWYSGGVNWRAAVAYVAGVVAGLLFVNTSILCRATGQLPRRRRLEPADLRPGSRDRVRSSPWRCRPKPATRRPTRPPWRRRCRWTTTAPARSSPHLPTV